jgi:hypothetical protein
MRRIMEGYTLEDLRARQREMNLAAERVSVVICDEGNYGGVT